MSVRSLLPALWEKASEHDGSFRNLHQEIDRVFDEFSHGKFRPFSRDGNGGFLSLDVDVSETDEAIEISAELPGVDEKDIDVSVAGQRLIIKGEKKAETKTEDADQRIVERSYGSFMRTFTLPFEADMSSVSAHFDKGVLKVTLPKPPEAATKTHKIEIKSGA